MNSELFYVVTFLVVVVFTAVLSLWLSRKVQGIWAKLFIVLIGFLIGTYVGIYGPLKQARVVTDSVFLASGPFQTYYAMGTGPESPTVKLIVINSTGNKMFLEVERYSREVTFSRVIVPSEIQF